LYTGEINLEQVLQDVAITIVTAGLVVGGSRAVGAARNYFRPVTTIGDRLAPYQATTPPRPTTATNGAVGALDDVGATTVHGAERIAGASATRGGVLSVSEIANVRSTGQVFTQPNGATARVLQGADGRFSVVVDGDRGLVTTFRNLSQSSLDRLAKNYGWVPE